MEHHGFRQTPFPAWHSFPRRGNLHVMDELRIRKRLREQAGLDAEILQEMAEALGNSGERVEKALAKLQESLSRIRELESRLAFEPHGVIPIRASLEEEVRLYNSLRQQALEQFRWLIIHREALGIRNHAQVAEQYPIPPPMKPKGLAS